MPRSTVGLSGYLKNHMQPEFLIAQKWLSWSSGEKEHMKIALKEFGDQTKRFLGKS